jgi:hypothetical protein
MLVDHLRWRPRVAVFLIVLTGFVALSANRFSDLAWADRKLDLLSQADFIGTPAREYLAGRLEHAARIGCLSSNPEWPDGCLYLWYSMLPLYVDYEPGSEGRGYSYLLFISNPQSAESAELQASRIKSYRVAAPLAQGALLLQRRDR